MPITITIKDKFVTDRLTQHIEDELCTYYPDAILKKIKVPSAAKLAKSILADEKFVAEFTKKLTEKAMITMAWQVGNSLDAISIPQLDALIAECDKHELEKHASLEDKKIDRLVQALQKCGYDVTLA